MVKITFSPLPSVSCGRPLSSQLNHAVESVDKGERIPHPGKMMELRAIDSSLINKYTLLI